MQKTLIVDIGGTLLKGSRPGAYKRAHEWCSRESGSLNRAKQLDVARAILTAHAPDCAAAIVGDQLGLSEEGRNQLRVVLEESDGDVDVLPGAIDLLLGARELGWRVLAATNAVAWINELPANITQYLDGVLSSADLGFIKQDSAFWSAFSTRVELNTQMSLVIGDNVEADVMTPRTVGLAAINVDDDKFTLFELLRLIEELGDPPSGTIGLLAGNNEYEWGGRIVLPADNLQSCVQNVTRLRVSFCTSSVQIPGTIIRRSVHPPIACAQQKKSTPIPSLSWVVSSSDKRMLYLPKDLSDALVNAELELNDIDNRTRRYLISLVTEAKEPSIRKARIAEVVRFLKDENKS
jgi:FMN phosphatase YigB (HAD superfamily)